MLILTFQKRDIVSKILSGVYSVDLRKSEFAYSTVRFTKAYSIILKMLKKKNPNMMVGEGCLWGWVSNPDENMVKNYLNKGYVAMYVDVDKSKCVFSDYDMYTDYAQECTDNNKFILSTTKNPSRCIQCSFTTDAIVGVRGVFSCKDMILFPDITNCFYTMMLMRGIQSKSKDISSLNKLRVNNTLRKALFVTKQAFSYNLENSYASGS